MLTNPARLLRLEYAILTVVVLIFYAHLHLSWLAFALLFLVPDLSMLGYALNPRVGAAFYNLAHTIAIPFLCLSFGIGRHMPIFVAIGLIWLTHITVDRFLGYGLKYPTHFKDTHLQHI